MTPIINTIIQLNGDDDRQFLLDLRSNESLGVGVSVVYIYYLEQLKVNYPKKAGNVIYVGEAGRPSDATGIRFGQHISTEENIGADSGTVYSLSVYYWQGDVIRLKIFEVNNEQERKELEKQILISHVKEYGAIPICQGTTGENYKTTDIIKFDISEEIYEHID